MIDVMNRNELFAVLGKLKPNQLAQFGIMTPHHMVEHLAFSVQFANGKLSQKLYVTPERAQAIKQFILGDGAHPIGFKSPLLGEGLEPLSTSDLSAAIHYLDQELRAFDAYFADHPTSTPINPMLGELSYSEWIGFHNKHFSHHFKQFGLLAD